MAAVATLPARTTALIHASCMSIIVTLASSLPQKMQTRLNLDTTLLLAKAVKAPPQEEQEMLTSTYSPVAQRAAKKAAFSGSFSGS